MIRVGSGTFRDWMNVALPLLRCKPRRGSTTDLSLVNESVALKKIDDGYVEAVSLQGLGE